MTTIVYRDNVMAADGRASVADWAMPWHCPKIRRLVRAGTATKSEIALLVGLAGDPYDFDAFCAYLLGDGPRPKWDDTTAALVVEIKTGRVWKYALAGRLQIFGWAAIGSGTPVALGALHAGATALEAVAIAARVDPYTGEPFQQERRDGD